MAKIYNALLLNCIKPEIEKIIRKNQNDFWRNRSTSQILTICWILGVCVKNLEVTLLFVDFSKDSWLHTQRKDRANTSGEWSPEETITAIMILWIELPWPENPANTYTLHTETLDSCFDLIRSHQQRILWSLPLEIEPATTDCRAETVDCGSVVEFRLCNLWLLVWSPVVEITVYTADEI